MRAWHDFNPMTPEEQIQAKYKPLPGKRYLICKKCDTVVAYNMTLSVRDVNQRMDVGKIPCIPKHLTN